MKARGKFIIHTQNEALLKVISKREVQPSKSSTKNRLPSKTHSLPLWTHALSFANSNSIIDKFSPRTLNVNDPVNLHQLISVVLIISLLTILSDTNFPTIQDCPHWTILFTSVAQISTLHPPLPTRRDLPKDSTDHLPLLKDLITRYSQTNLSERFLGNSSFSSRVHLDRKRSI
jgi:hypothetical protein